MTNISHCLAATALQKRKQIRPLQLAYTSRGSIHKQFAGHESNQKKQRKRRSHLRTGTSSSCKYYHSKPIRLSSSCETAWGYKDTFRTQSLFHNAHCMPKTAFLSQYFPAQRRQQASLVFSHPSSCKEAESKQKDCQKEMQELRNTQ